MASAMMAITFWVPDSCAFDEGLTLGQSADGTITTTLSGFRPPCSYGFVGLPDITISGGQILIVSHAFAMGCPSLEGADPMLFTQNAILGVLADGAYTLRWTQTDAAPTFQVKQQFWVKAGLLSVPSPETIPALSQWSLILSVLLMCYVGSLRWRPLTRRSRGRSAIRRRAP